MIAGAMLLAVPAFAQNTFEGHYTRPLGDVLKDRKSTRLNSSHRQ